MYLNKQAQEKHEASIKKALQSNEFLFLIGKHNVKTGNHDIRDKLQGQQNSAGIDLTKKRSVKDLVALFENLPKNDDKVVGDNVKNSITDSINIEKKSKSIFIQAKNIQQENKETETENVLSVTKTENDKFKEIQHIAEMIKDDEEINVKIENEEDIEKKSKEHSEIIDREEEESSNEIKLQAIDNYEIPNNVAFLLELRPDWMPRRKTQNKDKNEQDRENDKTLIRIVEYDLNDEINMSKELFNTEKEITLYEELKAQNESNVKNRTIKIEDQIDSEKYSTVKDLNITNVTLTLVDCSRKQEFNNEEKSNNNHQTSIIKQQYDMDKNNHEQQQYVRKQITFQENPNINIQQFTLKERSHTKHIEKDENNVSNVILTLCEKQPKNEANTCLQIKKEENEGKIITLLLVDKTKENINTEQYVNQDKHEECDNKEETKLVQDITGINMNIGTKEYIKKYFTKLSEIEPLSLTEIKNEAPIINKATKSKRVSFLNVVRVIEYEKIDEDD